MVLPFPAGAYNFVRGLLSEVIDSVIAEYFRCYTETVKDVSVRVTGR